VKAKFSCPLEENSIRPINIVSKENNVEDLSLQIRNSSNIEKLIVLPNAKTSFERHCLKI